MAPVGIFVGLGGVGLLPLRRPPGSPPLVLFAWPALFGSLGYQFLRAAVDSTDAWGLWLCGVLFLLMAAAPLFLVLSAERGTLKGAAPRRRPAGDRRPPTAATSPSPTRAPMVPVTFVTADDSGDPDLAESLDRLSRLHRGGDLSDAEFADAKQQVLGGG